jgi:hypothetical protein
VKNRFRAFAFSNATCNRYITVVPFYPLVNTYNIVGVSPFLVGLYKLNAVHS